jgi:hypothetical protein
VQWLDPVVIGLFKPTLRKSYSYVGTKRNIPTPSCILPQYGMQSIVPFLWYLKHWADVLPNANPWQKFSNGVF